MGDRSGLPDSDARFRYADTMGAPRSALRCCRSCLGNEWNSPPIRPPAHGRGVQPSTALPGSQRKAPAPGPAIGVTTIRAYRGRHHRCRREDTPIMTLETHHNIDLAELDEQSYLHPFTSVTASQRTKPWMIEGGSGIHITDARGQTYIDATSGLICVECRLRARGGCQSHLRPGAEAVLLPYLLGHRERAGGETRGPHCRHHPGQHAPRHVRHLGIGRERYPDQALLVLQQRAGAAEEEEDHRPGTRLPRHHARRCQRHRDACPAQAVRPAPSPGHLDLGTRLRQEGPSPACRSGTSPGRWPASSKS